MTPYEMFSFLIFGHVLGDFPLQGDFLAKGKNPFKPLDNVPWITCMLAHSIIHGGFVLLVTGTLSVGVAETIVHFIIDWCKCADLFGYNVDQLLHVLCKVLWVIIVIHGTHA